MNETVTIIVVDDDSPDKTAKIASLDQTRRYT